MSNNHHSERFPDALPTDAERRTRAGHTLWETLGLLYRWRRFILGMTGATAVLALVLSLLMANWYRAETRVMLPAKTGSGLVSSAILNNLPSAARSLISGGGGDYLRYLTVLSSRTVYESVVDTFDLVHVYDVADGKTPRQDAVAMLQDNVEFLIDDEYDFLIVAVFDTDPQRAAEMANFFVTQLEHINARLASQSARKFRLYVERRHDETMAGLDATLAALRTFQEQYGVLDLEKQGEQFYTYLAELRLGAIQLQGQYEVLRSQYGPDNAQVEAARQAVAVADRTYRQALEGQEELLPVPASTLPEVALRYVELERERLILTKLLEYTRPVLEEARFDEERQVEAVQVVDEAVPPVKKARPRRSVICIAATLSAFILAVLFVLAYTWWQRNHAYFAQRLRAAAAEPEPARAPAPESPASEPVPSR